MQPEMSILKALADENRVRSLLALRHGELCVCQLIAMLDLAPSTVSKHLSLLKQARLVESRKVGRWIYYRLPGREAPPAVRAALDHLQELFAADERIQADHRRLRQIRSIEPEELCRPQTSS